MGLSLTIHGILLASLLIWGPDLIEPGLRVTPVAIEIAPATVIDRGDSTGEVSAPSPAPAGSVTEHKAVPRTAEMVSGVISSPAVPGELGVAAATTPAAGGSVETGIVGGKEDQKTKGEGGTTLAGCLYGPPPVYPQVAKRAGWEGRVTVRVLIDADGTAATVTVRESSGHEALDAAAVRAIQKWRFSPARQGSQAVASFHDVRVRFRLVDG